jgi:hypothetical protein
MNELIVLLQAAPEAFRARSVLLAARQTVNGNHKQQDPSPYAAQSVGAWTLRKHRLDSGARRLDDRCNDKLLPY